MNKTVNILHFIYKNIPGSIFMFWFLFLLLPKTIFDLPISPVLYAKDGQLLGAKIANNGQWHFSQTDSLSTKFKQAIIQFEDRNFYEHTGVDPRGLIRAFYQNIKVLGANDPYKKEFRIALSRKVGQVIKKASSLLGINLHETM